ncbi:DUF3047 domain-containing protein [Candidatus Omnitrophota bacterium]
MKKYQVALISMVLASLFVSCWVFAFALPKWFPFNSKNALREWQEKIFSDRVLYTVEPKQEGGYLSAQSKEACSGLVYKIKFHPSKNPMISWRWMVKKFPQKIKKSSKKSSWVEKDDYAARVYVIFPSWNILRIQSIEYIWDESLPIGKVMTSPYYKNLKLIVAESGTYNQNKWVFEERNICKDYEKAFGRRCKRKVGAIALMTDSDNTLSTAEALYKDIKVGYKK